MESFDTLFPSGCRSGSFGKVSDRDEHGGLEHGLESPGALSLICGIWSESVQPTNEADLNWQACLQGEMGRIEITDNTF